MTALALDHAPESPSLSVVPSTEGSPTPAVKAYAPAMPAVTDAPTFAQLNLPPALVAALARKELLAPFPIQTATIPDALAGHDILGPGEHRLRQDARVRPAAADPLAALPHRARKPRAV